MSASSSSDQPVTTYRQALDALRGHQKTGKGAPAYSRFVNRPLGRRFASLAFVLRRTPNQVTGLSALCTFTGVAVIATREPTVRTGLGTCALLVLGYALDSADGQLARLQGGGSVVGEWLDHVVDAVKISTLHLAVLVQWHDFGDRSDTALLIPLGFSAVATVLFFTIILNDQIRRARRGSPAMLLQGDGSSSALYSLAVAPTDYGLLCVVFALQGWATAFTWAYGLVFAATSAFLALALAKWFREMQTY